MYACVCTDTGVLRVLRRHDRLELKRSSTSTRSSQNYSQRRKQIAEVERKLLFIPVVFVLLRIWGSSNRIYTMITGNAPVWTMTLLQAICDPLQGAANAAAFGVMTERVRKGYLELCCSRCSESGFCDCCSGEAGLGVPSSYASLTITQSDERTPLTR